MKKRFFISATAVAMLASSLIADSATAYAATKYPEVRASVELNGKTIATTTDITIKSGKTETVYIPVTYLVTLLKGLGIQNVAWQKPNFHITLPSSIKTTVNLRSLKPGNGTNEIIVNGIDVQKVNSVDYSNTYYFPLVYVEKVLQYLGIHSSWDGKHWLLTTKLSQTSTSGSQTTAIPHPSINSVVWPSSSVTVMNNGTSEGSTEASGTSVSSQYWTQTEQAIQGIKQWTWTPYNNMNAFEIQGTYSSGAEMDQITAFLEEENGQWVWNGIMDDQSTFQVSGSNQSTQIAQTHNDIDYFVTPSS